MKLHFENFGHDFLTDNSLIQDTYQNPDRVQYLENSITLRCKRFINKTHLANLLLSTAIVDTKEIIHFAFWIPDEIMQGNIELVSILEVFTHRFGQKICIGSECSYFIKKTSRMFLGELNDEIAKLFTITGESTIDVSLFLPFNERQHLGIKYIDFFYCFAINHFKYHIWLYEINTKTIEVYTSQKEYFQNILSTLDPLKKINFKVNKSKNSIKTNSMLARTKENVCSIDVPAIHYENLNYLNETMKQMNEGESIAIVKQLEQHKCIFCNNTDLSREHIFAKWMRNYFEDTIGPAQIIVRNEDISLSLKRAIQTAKSSSYGHVIKAVCITCNNNWMSQLEDKVQKLLTSESKVKTNLNGLTTHEKNQIAQWSIMKMLLISLKNEINIVFSEDIYKNIMNNKIPSNFLVEHSTIDAYDLTYTYRKGGYGFPSLLRLNLYNKDQAIKISESFLMLTLQVGNLVFRISYWDDNCGLKRESCIKQTEVFFPELYKLPFFVPNNNDLWSDIEPSIQLFMFSTSISLTDYNL